MRLNAANPTCKGHVVISTSAVHMVYCCQASLTILYLYTLYNIYTKAKSTLLLGVVLLFIVSNVGLCFWVHFVNIYREEACSSFPDITKYKKAMIYLIISQFFVSNFYQLAHWLFAYKYWSMSYQIKQIFSSEDP